MCCSRHSLSKDLQTPRAQRRTARLFRGVELPLHEEELNELEPLSWVNKERRRDRGLWNQAGHQEDGNCSLPCDTGMWRCQRKIVRAQLKEIRSRRFFGKVLASATGCCQGNCRYWKFPSLVGKWTSEWKINQWIATEQAETPSGAQWAVSDRRWEQGGRM